MIILLLLLLLVTPAHADEIVYGDLTVTEDFKIGTTAPTQWNTASAQTIDEAAFEVCPKNEVFKSNGSVMVCAVYNATFTFSCTGFSDGEDTIQLIGTGNWKAAEAISFTAAYNNGPPTTADIKKSINGAGYATINAMDGPTYTTGNNTAAVAYPAAKDQYLRFRLDSSDGVDSDIDYDSAIYFRNKVFYGSIAKADTFTEADIEGLSSSTTNDYTISQAINAAAGEYIVLAYPTTYTAMDAGSDYETDGGTDFKFNSIAIAMTQDNAALGITNSAGYAENYDVYVSDLAALGNHTFVNHTSDQTINPFYYGVISKADTYTEADCEGLTADDGYAPVTNDYTQVWTTINLAAGEYGLWCIPKRHGIAGTDYDFKDYDTGLGFDFQAPETVGITNVNGWSEDYFAYRTTNSGLGDITVETK